MPELFTGVNPVTSYNYTDLTANFTREEFYIGRYRAEQVITSGMIMTNRKYYSDVTFLKYTTNSSVSIKIIDSNADLSFNIPRIIEGDVIVSIPFIGGPPSGSGNCWLSGLLFIQKISGATTTNLGNSSINIFTQSGATTLVGGMRAVNINVARTKFKRNDTFRVNMKIYGKTDGGVAFDLGIGCDPANRTVPAEEFTGTLNTALNTIFSLQIPFKLTEV